MGEEICAEPETGILFPPNYGTAASSLGIDLRGVRKTALSLTAARTDGFLLLQFVAGLEE